MAVIREQRQFKIGTIGVARASEGGRIVGQAISRSADQFADMFYREGLQVAEKAGQEAAQSVEPERIMTINPTTGEPEAYTPPAPFGRVAAEAYQRVVQRRFQSSMDDEMRAKSAELAARYENNPNGTALYETAMSDYIAAMAENAQGQFQGYISDVGASYLNLTRSNLAIRQMRREREAAARAQAAAAVTANNEYERYLSTYGPAGLESGSFAEAIRESSTQTVEDGYQSGLFDSNAVAQNSRSQNISGARGLITYAINNVTNSEDLAIIQSAIGTQNPNILPPEYSYLGDVLRSFSTDFEALRQLEQHSDGLAGDRAQYLTVLYERNQAEIARLENASIFDLNSGTPAATAVTRSIALNGQLDPMSIAQGAMNHYDRLTNQARSYAEGGRSDMSDAIIARRDSVFNGYIEGLESRVVQSLGRDQADDVERAIMEGNVSLAPESAREALSALFSLNRQGLYDIREELPSFVGSYRDSAGKAVDRENAAQAYSDFSQNVEGQIQNISLLRGEDVDAALSRAITDLNSIENLEDTVRSGALADAQFNAAKAYVSQFFESNPTEQQVNSALSILEGGRVTDGLNEDQVNLLASARNLITDSGRESNARTYVNGENRRYGERLALLEADRKRQADDYRIFYAGAGNPRSADDRIIVEERFQRDFSDVLTSNGYQSLGQMFADPSATQNENLRPVFNALMNMNVMPESLHNMLDSLADGSFVGNSPATLLSHYTNMRNYTYQGTTMRNPMMDALSEDQIAVLDFMVDASPIIGTDNESLARLFSARAQMQSDPAFQQRAEAFFGLSIPEFVRTLDGYDNLTPSARRGMEAAALNLFTFHGSASMSPRSVRRQLNEQLERSYPDGGGYVFGPNMSRRTRAALSYAAPNNEDVFIDFVNDTLATSAIDLDRAVLGTDLRGGISYRQQGNVFLQPIGVPTEDFVQYQVMEAVPLEQGGRRQVMQRIEIPDEDGNLVMTEIPLIITNRDPKFLEMVEQKRLREGSESIERARGNMLREEYSPAPEFEFGINP